MFGSKAVLRGTLGPTKHFWPINLSLFGSCLWLSISLNKWSLDPRGVPGSGITGSARYVARTTKVSSLLSGWGLSDAFTISVVRGKTGGGGTSLWWSPQRGSTLEAPLLYAGVAVQAWLCKLCCASIVQQGIAIWTCPFQSRPTTTTRKKPAGGGNSDLSNPVPLCRWITLRLITSG